MTKQKLNNGYIEYCQNKKTPHNYVFFKIGEIVVNSTVVVRLKIVTVC